MTMKEEIAQQIKVAQARKLKEYRGMDWWQLSAAEEQVFSIPLLAFPKLIVVWQAYLTFCDISGYPGDGYSPEAVAAERARLPHFFEGPVVDEMTFRALAMEWCGIGERLAHAVFEKVAFWNILAGGLIAFGAFDRVGEDDERAFLALADLGVQLGGLAVRHPDRRGKTLRLG